MVSETWFKCKLERLFANASQPQEYSYRRLRSARLSQVCQTFLSRSEDKGPSRSTIDNARRTRTRKSQSLASPNDCKLKENGPTCRLRWKSLRLSFNRKKPQTHETAGRSKPILPPVLKTSAMREEETGLQLDVNLAAFESKQRQLLNELALRRTQVDELKRELESSGLKIHELTKDLNSIRCTMNEKECNLKLAHKNAQFFERQLQSKRDAVTKARLQQESAVAEAKGLYELVQKSELENCKLNRELNELKAQHTCDVAYQNELMIQDKKIREKIAQINQVVGKCESGLVETQKLAQSIEKCNEVQKTADFYRGQFYNYKDKYAKLQEEFLYVSAALGNFQRLTLQNTDVMSINPEKDLLLSQLEKATELFEKKTSTKNEIIDNLTKALNRQKEANVAMYIHEGHLEMKVEELGEENVELKKKLSAYSKEYRNADTQTNDMIKKEVIELTDV